MSQRRLAKRARDSWDSARFHLCLRQGAGGQFAWFEADSVKKALSCPAQPPVTPAVGR